MDSFIQLAQFGSTGLGIALIIYMVIKDKTTADERKSFITAVENFTLLTGKTHESNRRIETLIEENSKVIRENGQIIQEFKILNGKNKKHR